MKYVVAFFTALAFFSVAIICASSQSHAQGNPSAITQIPTIGVLRSIPVGSAKFYPVVQVQGYYASGDLPSGAETFNWSSGDTTPDNACTVINPTGNGGNGRWLLNWSRTLNIRQCGAKGDGSTSDYTPFLSAFAALASVSGGTLNLSCGNYTLPSASFSGGSGYTVVNNVVVQGQRGCTTVTVTGASQVDGLFTARNPNNVWFKDFSCVGNGVATNADTGGCIYFYGTTGAAAVMRNFGSSYVNLDNWKNSYWIYARNDASFAMQNFSVDHVNIVTRSGNCINLNDVGISCDAIGVRGQVVNLGGSIDGIWITDGTGDGTNIKRFASIWSGTSDYHIDRPVIRNFGSNATLDVGSYAILVYPDDAGSIGATAPGEGWITDADISGAYQIGIYTAGTSGCLHIDNAHVTDQSASGASTLPEAAIAINSATCSDITSAHLERNYAGIWTGATDGGVVQIVSPVITSGVTNAIGINATYGPATSTATKTEIISPAITLTGAGSSGIFINSKSGSTLEPGSVSVLGGKITAMAYDIQTSDVTTGAGVVSAGVYLGGNLLLYGPPAVSAVFMSNTSTPLIIDGLVVDGSAFGTTTQGLSLPSELGLSIKSLTLRNRTTGSSQMFYVDGAHGSMPVGALQFVNVSTARQISSSTFCVATPNWTATLSTQIARCQPGEAGSAASKYIVMSDINTDGSTTWLNNRTLTGN